MSRSTSPSDREAKAAASRWRNSGGAPTEEDEEEEGSPPAETFPFLALASEASKLAVAAARTASTRPLSSSSLAANSAR